MELRTVVLKHVDQLMAYTSELSDEIKSSKALSSDAKNELLKDLNEIVKDALNDVKQSLIDDDNSTYFLHPLIVSCLTLGQIYGNLGSKKLVSELMSNYAKIRLLNDPRQVEKKFVKECWDKWKKEPLSYKTKTEFANDMLDKCEHLKSQKRITDWCREWESLPPS